MKIIAEDHGIDGSGLHEVSDQVVALLNWAITEVAPANGNRVEVELPTGDVVMRRPLGLNSSSCQLTLSSSGGTRLLRTSDWDPRWGVNHTIYATGMPGLRLINITCENVGIMTSGAHLWMDGVYEYEGENVHLIEGFRGLELTGCAGHNHWGGKIKGGNLIVVDPALGYAPGSALILLAPGTLGNNSIYFHGTAVDPTGWEGTTKSRYHERMKYEAAIWLRHCDGYDYSGGHVAGGSVAHLLIDPPAGAAVLAARHRGTHLDFGADSTVLIQGDGDVQDLSLAECTLQGGQRNVTMVNPRARDITISGGRNQFAAHEAVWIGAGEGVQIDGGTISGNNGLSRRSTVRVRGARKVQLTGVLVNGQGVQANVELDGGAADCLVNGLLSSGAEVPVRVGSDTRNCREVATVVA